MKQPFRWLMLFLALPTALAATSSTASGQAYRSIWDQRDPNFAYLYRDLKARYKGDMLTVIISENTDVANADSRTLEKQATSGSSITGDFDTGGSSGSGAMNFDASAQRKFDGDSNFSSAREFTDRMSVTVVDVLPNGNLLIAGKRCVLVEGDVRQLNLTGVVRGLDINSDNTVRSFQVADLRLVWDGNGPETKFTKQGWLGKRINHLWPF